MSTAERRRPACGDDRVLFREPLDERRDDSCCRPAFMAAAAWSDIDAERGDPAGDSDRGLAAAGLSPFDAMAIRLYGEQRARCFDGGSRQPRPQPLGPAYR